MAEDTKRKILDENLGIIAGAIIFRTLEGLADQPAVIDDSLTVKTHDFSKPIDTALKVLRYFEFEKTETDLDPETLSRLEELRTKLPKQLQKKQGELSEQSR